MRYSKGFDHKQYVAARCRMMKCPHKTNPAKVGTTMFRVPKERLELWVKLSGNAELLELPLDHLKKNMHFCELHFRKDRILHGLSRKNLLKGSDPIFFPDGHTPLSNDTIEAWKNARHFGVNHPKPQVIKPGPSKENCSPASLPDSTGSLPDSSSFLQDIRVPQDAQSINNVPLGVQGQVGAASVAGETCVQISSAAAGEEWELQYMLTTVGNRLLAIPCYSAEIKGLQQ